MRLVRNKVLKATGIFKFKCDKYVKSVIEVLSIGGPRLYCFSWPALSCDINEFLFQHEVAK